MALRVLLCIAIAACLSATTSAAPTLPRRPLVANRHASWFPDSRRIAFESNLARPKTAYLPGEGVAYDDPGLDVFSVAVDGSGLRNLTRDTPDVADIHPSVSPDGARIAFLRRTSGAFELVVRTADGADERVLASDARPHAPEWSPDGREIAFVSCCDGEQSRITVVDSDGRSRRSIASAAARVAWSPDGSRLAYVGPHVGNPAVFVVDRGGGSPRAVAGRVGGETVAWSPDSTRIAFALEGARGSSGGIAAVSADGGTLRVLVEGFGSQPDWSPSGRHLAFSHYLLETVDVETREIRFVTGGPLGEPRWSPDGNRIAFTAADSSGTSSSVSTYVEVVRPDGRGRTRVTPEAPPAVQSVVPVESVARPDRLMVTSVSVSPRAVRRGGSVTARVLVETVLTGNLVDGAEVSVRGPPGPRFDRSPLWGARSRESQQFGCGLWRLRGAGGP